MFAATAAGIFNKVEDVMQAMGQGFDAEYYPDKTAAAIYAKAVYNSAVLEQIAHMALLTEQINPDAPRLKDALIKKHFERKHGQDAYYGQ